MGGFGAAAAPPVSSSSVFGTGGGANVGMANPYAQVNTNPYAAVQNPTTAQAAPMMQPPVSGASIDSPHAKRSRVDEHQGFISAADFG